LINLREVYRISTVAMKKILLFCSFTIFIFSAVAQKDFIGIAKYNICTIGSENKQVDSIMVVFGEHKIKLTFFLPSSNVANSVSRKSVIIHFENKQQFEVDEDNFTYTQIPFMVSPADYRFKNTGQYDAVINKLCLQYAADSISPSKANVKKAICNASIDWGFHSIDNYSYLGVMPLVVDNRLVLSADEFLKDGKVAKVYMTTAEERRSTEESFNLMEYKIIK